MTIVIPSAVEGSLAIASASSEGGSAAPAGDGKKSLGFADILLGIERGALDPPIIK